MTTIRKVLVANRGEIAVRIMRTAKERGLKTVAVYSDTDTSAFHVRMADEAVHIGGAAPAESYLNIAAIIEAAKKTGADAIHPGYGFLSECANFAQSCRVAGVVYIGPPPEAIAAMGDKAEAKRRMIAAGVPCVPGYQDEDQSDAWLGKEAERIGFPVMVKASAGGGGRGVRLVESANGLKDALASARNEAKSAFGDDRLLIEKTIVGARHVEIQIVADKHGNIVHLGERDCSLQRRRQKVIEEAPSPVVTPELRSAMGAAAVEAASAVKYESLGTVEFLFDPKTKEFYFLEMNTRLQVEHPVTEYVTGLDLVDLQFEIAEGKQLSIAQEEVRLDGWAIEARLYAEDPSHGFLPQTGEISTLYWPDMPRLRIDAGVEESDSVSAYYDPIVAKLIAYGDTRIEARERLAVALEETTLLGVKTNADFLIALLRDDAFAKGETDTVYIEAHLARLAPASPRPTASDIALVAAALCERPFDDLLTGWNSRGRCFFPLKLDCDGAVIAAEASICGHTVTARLKDVESTLELLASGEGGIVYRENGVDKYAEFARSGTGIDLKANGRTRRFVDMTFAPAEDAGGGADFVRAPMAGVVTAVMIKAGDVVAKGDVVATIEAMKMEHRLVAPRSGVVEDTPVKAGEQVSIRAVIARLAPQKES